MSLLSGEGLSVGFLITCLDFSLPVEGYLFLMSLLSGGGLSVGFLITCLRSSLPVEGHFS